MDPDESPVDGSAGSERRFPDATRRTYFAEERTLLAWWRCGIASAAVALGVGYGLLAVMFVVGGSLRERQSRRALVENRFAEVPGWVIGAVTFYLSVLVVLTVVALL